MTGRKHADTFWNQRPRFFGPKGLRAATIEQICRKAKANTAAANYHFGSKEGLKKACRQPYHLEEQKILHKLRTDHCRHALIRRTGRGKCGQYRLAKAALLLSAFFRALAFPGGSAAGPSRRGAGGPPLATVAAVTLQDVNPPVEYMGHVETVQAVDLRARVEGFLEQVDFTEGYSVDVLTYCCLMIRTR